MGTPKPDPDAPMPDELVRAVNLMTHPVAGMMAFSALGFGLASHAFGIWAGAMSGAVAASQRLGPQMLDGLMPAPAEAVRLNAVEQARAAIVTSFADARIAAAKAADETVKAASVVARVAPAKSKGAPVSAKDAPEAKKSVLASAGPVLLQPASMPRPQQPDDLKAISGVGPKLEQVLNGLGVFTYAQIAGWNASEVGWMDNELGFRSRIGRDDWMNQAAKLASAKG